MTIKNNHFIEKYYKHYEESIRKKNVKCAALTLPMETIGALISAKPVLVAAAAATSRLIAQVHGQVVTSNTSV